jgi:hypothetical protein
MQPLKRRHFAIRRLIENDLRLGHILTKLLSSNLSRKYSQICDAFYQKTVSKSMDEGQLRKWDMRGRCTLSALQSPRGSAKERSTVVSTVKDTRAATSLVVERRLALILPG